MTNPVTPPDYAALLESLRVTEDGPAEMHGWELDAPWFVIVPVIQMQVMHGKATPAQAADYFQARCRRAEANRKPSTLLEDVKACMRAGMDAMERHKNASWVELEAITCKRFRKLSEAGDK